MRVVFYLPPAHDLAALRQLDPDRDWRRMKRGERWVVQSYLRLRQAGHAVELDSTPPREGLVVFHNRHKHELRRALAAGPRPVLVGIRGDRREATIADFEILQNGRWADGRRRFFIPYWPQPGLLPRDPARGDRLRCLAYKGFDANLKREFRARAWQEFLTERGVAWRLDSMDYDESERGEVRPDWADYREVDAILAVRDDDGRGHTSKPATKLYNAWLAGVPALLGPDHAYRELRRSPLDFLEVLSTEQAAAAVIRLQEERGLYLAMVQHGRRRGAEFGVEGITRRWSELLYRTIPERVGRWPARLERRVPLALLSPWR
ncbi:MAG TPA: hypothetical protein VJS92_00045, partial [Candidatus Polarisedimenticolaceae bacterium]|nr:hypothetical protein [Candidatus Polarisedimenticolaceae bacterium]